MHNLLICCRAKSSTTTKQCANHRPAWDLERTCLSRLPAHQTGSPDASGFGSSIGRCETSFPMGAITKRFVLRCTATAKGYCWLVRTCGETITVGIGNVDGTFDDQWSIVSNSNVYIRHEYLLRAVESVDRPMSASRCQVACLQRPQIVPLECPKSLDENAS